MVSLTSPAPVRAVYLDSREEPVFGLLHPSSGDGRRDLAVLMLAPFGWEEVASYRSRRDWAVQLADAGISTLRLDLPSTGDSAGSPRDPDVVPRWFDAVRVAAEWLRASTGARRVVAIGMGLGGVLACAAVAEGVRIDDLVLWATPSRGDRLLRELRAFSRLQGSDFPGPARGPESVPGGLGAERQEDDLHVGGFVLTRETIDAIDAIDLTRTAVPCADRRRILMLGRDGSSPDVRLQTHLEQAGAAVEVAPGPGYGSMTAKPHEARPPLEVFARVAAWLEEGAGRAQTGAGRPEGQDSGLSPTPGQRVPATELEAAGTRIRELALSIEQPFGRLFGVLSEPIEASPAPLCAVLLNAGAMRHAGPNRLWVEVARRWAASGVATLRLDVAGLGDSDGEQGSAELEALYDASRVAQVQAALDELQARGLGPRFVLVGLCSGAYWSFHAALEDERVAAALMLNPRALFWDPTIEKMRELRMGLLKPKVWRRALRGDFSLARIARLLRWAPLGPLTAVRRATTRRRARRSGKDAVEDALNRLRDSDKQLLMAFSGEEPLHEELEREGRLRHMARWPNVVLESLPGNTHALCSPPAQQATHRVLDRALLRELERTGRPGPGIVPWGGN